MRNVKYTKEDLIECIQYLDAVHDDFADTMMEHGLYEEAEKAWWFKDCRGDLYSAWDKMCAEANKQKHKAMLAKITEIVQDLREKEKKKVAEVIAKMEK